MKITKLVHACLLVENEDKKILADPGNYSWQSGVVTEEFLRDIDMVVVTHAHPDHLDKDFAQAIKSSSPAAQWYGTGEAAGQLAEWGIDANTTSDRDEIRFIESSHADLSPWFPAQPEHTSFLLFGELLIGGDCHTLTDMRGARIFAGAVSGGPWGGVVGYAKMIEALETKPEIVVPLHDWHWNEEARAGIYGRLPDVMSKLGTEFVALENGVSQVL